MEGRRKRGRKGKVKEEIQRRGKESTSTPNRS